MERRLTDDLMHVFRAWEVVMQRGGTGKGGDREKFRGDQGDGSRESHPPTFSYEDDTQSFTSGLTTNKNIDGARTVISEMGSNMTCWW